MRRTAVSSAGSNGRTQTKGKIVQFSDVIQLPLSKPRLPRGGRASATMRKPGAAARKIGKKKKEEIRKKRSHASFQIQKK